MIRYISIMLMARCETCLQNILCLALFYAKTCSNFDRQDVIDHTARNLYT